MARNLFTTFNMNKLSNRKFFLPLFFVYLLLGNFNSLAQDQNYEYVKLDRPKLEMPLLLFPTTFMVNNFSSNMPGELVQGIGGEFSLSIFPSSWQPLALEFKGGLSRYNTNNETLFYAASDRNVIFQNNFNHALLGIKYVNIQSRNFAKLNLGFYGGYGYMRGRTKINNPESDNALLNDLFHTDNTFIYGSEITLEFNLNKSRKNLSYKGQGVFLQFIAGAYRGGEISYVNTRNLIDEQAYFDDFGNNVYSKAFDNALDQKRFTILHTAPLRFTTFKISMVNRF